MRIAPPGREPRSVAASLLVRHQVVSYTLILSLLLVSIHICWCFSFSDAMAVLVDGLEKTSGL